MSTKNTTSETPTHRPCECTGVFCSAKLLCTDKEFCSCSCGVFLCQCSCNKSLMLTGHKSHVSEDQRERIIEFQGFLASLNGTSISELNNQIDLINQSLDKNDDQTYYKEAEKAENLLMGLSQSNKNSINDWIAAKGFENRI